jgi:HemY protein
MRAGLWLLVLFALAVALALAARFDAGYVLVVYPPWRVEMSLVLAVTLAALLFGVLYVSLRVLRLALRLPADVRAWRRRRRSDKAEDEFSRAVAALLAGQPEHARRLARGALRKAHMPLTALVAAQAAADLGDRQAALADLEEAKSEVGELIAARQAIERRLEVGQESPAGEQMTSPPASGN